MATKQKNGTKGAPAKADILYEGTKDAPALTVTQIPMAAIDVVQGFNARIQDKDRPDGEGASDAFRQGSEKEPVIGVGSPGTDGESLQADIKRNGLLQPILVRPVGARFALVAGHRRHQACMGLGWRTIPCVVRAMSEEEAYIINLTENVQREDLSPGEIADRCVMLKTRFPETFGGTDGGASKLATMLGVTRGYMNNLVRMAEKLHPDIWRICRSGKNRNAPPHHKLHRWLGMEHDEQWEEFQKWLGVASAEDKGDGGTTPTTPPTPEPPKGPEYKRPNLAALLLVDEAILALSKEGKIKDAEKQIARTMLLYCIGRCPQRTKDGVVSFGDPPTAPYVVAKVATVKDAK